MRWKPFILLASCSFCSFRADLSRRWLALRRAWVARRAAQIMNAYVIPGIPPLTWRQWLLLIIAGAVLFELLFGGIGFLAAPAPARGQPLSMWGQGVACWGYGGGTDAG